MNTEDSERVTTVLDELGEDEGVFLWCSADPDGEPLLMLDLDTIDSRRLLTLLRKAQDKAILQGSVKLVDDAPVFHLDEQPPDLMLEQLQGVFAEVDARLAQSQVKWGEEEEAEAGGTDWDSDEWDFDDDDDDEEEVKPASEDGGGSDWDSDEWDFDDDDEEDEVAEEAPPARAVDNQTSISAESPAPAAAETAQPTIEPNATHAPVPAPPRASRPAPRASLEDQLTAALNADPTHAPLYADVVALKPAAQAARGPVDEAAATRDARLAEARSMLDGLSGKNGQTWTPRLRAALDAAAAAADTVNAQADAAAPATDALTDAQYALSDAVTAAGDNTVNGLSGALYAQGKQLPWFPDPPLPGTSGAGPAAATGLNALSRTAAAMKKAAKDFKMVARTRRAEDMLPCGAPDLTGLEGHSATDPNVVTARGHLLATLDAVIEANRQVQHYLGYRRDLSEAQVVVVDANAETCGRLVAMYHDAAIRLAH